MKTILASIFLFFSLSVTADIDIESLKMNISASFNVSADSVSVNKLNASNYYKVIISGRVYLSDGSNLIDGRVISIADKSDLLAVAKAELEAQKLLNNASKKVELSSMQGKPLTKEQDINTSYQLVNQAKLSSATSNANLIKQQVSDYSHNPTNLPFPKKQTSKTAILRDISARITQTLPDESTIVFPAVGEVVKDVITVITDPGCVYCQRLHKDIQLLNEEGYTVRYMLFPIPKRSGDKFVPNPNAIVNIQATLCSNNPIESTNKLFLKRGNYHAPHNMETCDLQTKNAADLFHLGKFAFAAQGGTPVIMSKNGFVSSLNGSNAGYDTLAKLISNLKEFEPEKVATLK